METHPPSTRISSAPSCFQFVKRMNGNTLSPLALPKAPNHLLPIREAYEWKQEIDLPSIWEFLLPIREAYEWKLPTPPHSPGSNSPPCFQFVKRMNGNYDWLAIKGNLSCRLLPIREAYEWKPTRNPTLPNLATVLLPIREAYEWKLWSTNNWHTFPPNSCFQFVKRMNGNPNFVPRRQNYIMTCFQFVKRMNGNSRAARHFVVKNLLPIREAYEWKHFWEP